MAVYELSLPERALQVYHGWHDLVVTQYGGSVIDADAGPPVTTPVVFHDLGEVQSAILDLSKSKEIDDQPNKLIPARFAASLMLLRALEGEQIDFHEYVETLMGITPEAIDEDELLSERSEIEKWLLMEGYGFDIPDSRAFAEQFGLIEGKAAIGAVFQNYVELGSVAIAKALSEPRVAIQTDALEENLAWTGRYITDEQGRPQMFINTHPRHPFTHSKLKLNAFHEPAHAVHFDILRRGIATGKIKNPFLGVTTLHGPEQIHLEAVSQLTEQIMMRRSGTFEDMFQAMFARYRTRVLQNAHYRINTNHEFQAVEDYVRQHIPFEPPANIQGSLNERRNDPVRRAYYYGYAPALKLVESILQQPPEIQNPRLGHLYSFLGTPGEVAAAAAGLQR